MEWYDDNKGEGKVREEINEGINNEREDEKKGSGGWFCASIWDNGGCGYRLLGLWAYVV